MTPSNRAAIAQAVEALEKAEQVYIANDIHPLSIHQCQRAISALSALLAEPETDDARDAKFYRWLRDKSEPGICSFYLSVGMAFAGVRFMPKTVDEAIAAAIASQGTTP